MAGKTNLALNMTHGNLKLIIYRHKAENDGEIITLSANIEDAHRGDDIDIVACYLVSFLNGLLSQ